MKPFKFRTERRGQHIHVTVFVSNSAGNTYQNAGHLVLDEWQWEILKRRLDFKDDVERVPS